MEWGLYGRRTELEQLQAIVRRGRWFFVKLSGRRRIGKTTLIQRALVLLAHPRAPRFFAIENVDHALHPRLARALVGHMSTAIKEHKRQVLLTTHNPLVLDGLPLADDDARLFTVERTNHGATEVTRVLSTDEVKAAHEAGLTLSQMWNQGIVGGVPELG